MSAATEGTAPAERKYSADSSVKLGRDLFGVQLEVDRGYRLLGASLFEEVVRRSDGDGWEEKVRAGDGQIEGEAPPARWPTHPWTRM